MWKQIEYAEAYDSRDRVIRELLANESFQDIHSEALTHGEKCMRVPMSLTDGEGRRMLGYFMIWENSVWRLYVRCGDDDDAIAKVIEAWNRERGWENAQV